MNIEVRGVTKAFGGFVALRDLSLTVPSGELVALLGPSGSGKTTLLRVIAGLAAPDAGQVLFDGRDTTARSARDRRIGFVFQHYALFKHMSVFENVAFGLRVRPRDRRLPEAAIREKVTALLRLVHVDWLADRRPSELSGGQRQRVALARALAVEPSVLLLDEPFGSLDAKVRLELRRWLRRLHDEMHITSAFVTHDQDEALEVADRVVVLNEGRVEQTGTPEEVYDHPATPFVYQFLGSVNLFRGRIEAGRTLIGDGAVALPGPAPAAAGSAAVYVRPHLLEIHRHPEGESHFKAVVGRLVPSGAVVRVELTTEWGESVQVEASRERARSLELRTGEEVFLVPHDVKVFHHPGR